MSLQACLKSCAWIIGSGWFGWPSCLCALRGVHSVRLSPTFSSSSRIVILFPMALTSGVAIEQIREVGFDEIRELFASLGRQTNLITLGHLPVSWGQSRSVRVVSLSVKQRGA